MRVFIRCLSLVAMCVACFPSLGEKDWLASVNGERVLLEEFERRLRVTQKDLGDIPVLPKREIDTIKHRILGELVNQRLLLQEVDRRGIEVSKPEIDQEADRLSSSMDARAWQGYLLEHYVDQRVWRQHLRQRMLVERLIQDELERRNPVTDTEIQRYYDEHVATLAEGKEAELYQIVVRERALAEQLLKKIKAGESFEQLARTHSIGPESARDGRLGYVDEDSLPASFAPAFKLAPGQMSGVVETEYGFHLFWVTGIRQNYIPPLAKMRDSVRVKVTQEHITSVRRDLLESLRATADIKMNQAVWERIVGQ